MYRNGEPGAEGVPELLGAANTEVKCALLGVLGLVGSTMTDAQVRGELDKRNAFALRGQPPDSSHLGDILQRMPSKIVRTEENTMTGKREHELSPALGGLALALAGGLMGLSFDRGRAIRTFVGERRQQGKDAERSISTTDAIANRLATYMSALLVRKDRSGWFERQHLLVLATIGMEASDPAVRKVLKKLVETRQLEQRVITSKKIQYRFLPADEFSDPEGLVRDYVDLVGRIAKADRSTIESGSARLATILNDNKRLPFLIQRSYAATRHTGKHTPRAPRPAHHQDPVTPSFARPVEVLPM